MKIRSLQTRSSGFSLRDGSSDGDQIRAVFGGCLCWPHDIRRRPSAAARLLSAQPLGASRYCLIFLSRKEVYLAEHSDYVLGLNILMMFLESRAMMSAAARDGVKWPTAELTEMDRLGDALKALMRSASEAKTLDPSALADWLNGQDSIADLNVSLAASLLKA